MGYSSLDAAYHEGLETFFRGEPDNLWAYDATDEEAAFWQHGWRDGANMQRSEDAWDRMTKEVSAVYRDLDIPERRRDPDGRGHAH